MWRIEQCREIEVGAGTGELEATLAEMACATKGGAQQGADGFASPGLESPGFESLGFESLIWFCLSELILPGTFITSGPGFD